MKLHGYKACKDFPKQGLYSRIMQAHLHKELLQETGLKNFSSKPRLLQRLIARKTENSLEVCYGNKKTE